MKRFAVVTNGWHFPYNFYQRIKQQIIPSGWICDYFCVMHRLPLNTLNLQNEKNYSKLNRDNNLERMDIELYSESANLEKLQSDGWICILKPNTIENIEYFEYLNQWLDDYDWKLYDIICNTYDDHYILSNYLFYDILTDNMIYYIKDGEKNIKHKDNKWLFLSNCIVNNRLQSHSNIIFLKKDSFEKMELKGLKIMTNTRMNDLLNFFHNNNIIYGSINVNYRINKYLINCESGMISNINFFNEEFLKSLELYNISLYVFPNSYNIFNASHFVNKDELYSINNIYVNSKWNVPFHHMTDAFNDELLKFQEMIKLYVMNKENKTFIHFGDGDYNFLNKIPSGSANPGKRALSISYESLNIQPFLKGFTENDYYLVECFRNDVVKNFNTMFKVKAYPTEFIYGLVANRWFTKTFHEIGLIGADNKISVIQELMKYIEYQEYLGLTAFKDYIKIPQKFACDNLENTEKMVMEQLKNATSTIFLVGVGHVKSGLLHRLKQYKSAVYLDVGSGIDALAGMIDKQRPYMNDWTNYIMMDYDYSSIDYLQYKRSECEQNEVYL